jgi:hypothetical protein
MSGNDTVMGGSDSSMMGNDYNISGSAATGSEVGFDDIGSDTIPSDQATASLENPTSDMEMRSNEERFDEPVEPLETLPSGLAISRNTGAGQSENQASGI